VAYAWHGLAWPGLASWYDMAWHPTHAPESPVLLALLHATPQPEYSMLALHTPSGKYWLYWCPSQYTAAIKIRIIGVHALL
jgi:hypothetical protein